MIENDPDTMAQVEKLTNAVNELSRIVAEICMSMNELDYKGNREAWMIKRDIDLIDEPSDDPKKRLLYIDGNGKGF